MAAEHHGGGVVGHAVGVGADVGDEPPGVRASLGGEQARDLLAAEAHAKVEELKGKLHRTEAGTAA